MRAEFKPKKESVTFALGALTSFVLFVPRSSEGFFETRIHAAECFVDGPAPMGKASNGSSRGVRPNPNAAVQLWCPIPDNRAVYLPENINTMNVHGQCSGTPSTISAAAGTTFFGNNTGGRIGTFQTFSCVNPQQFGLQLGSFFVATDAADFKYITVAVSSASNADVTVRGIFLFGP